MSHLSTLDLVVFLAYLAALTVIGLRAGHGRADVTAQQFFLTSRTLPWYVVGFSIIAAGISSEQFLGTVGYAYTYGLAVANWEWLNGPALLLLVFVFVPYYLRKEVVTMPQFLEMRFDGRTRVLFAVLTLLIYTFINLAGVIYSGGVAFKGIFRPDDPLGFDLIYPGIVIITLIGGLFAIWGGMESVAWTNTFQSVLLIGGGLLVFFLGLNQVPGGWDTIVGEGERGRLILPADHPEIPWTALVVLALSTNVWFFCTNQTINQSALGAKNEWHARMGVLLAGFLGILIAFADTFPGLIGYALQLSIADANGKTDEAYLHVINALVPSGVKGLVYAGLFGAILSTIEALVNAASTIFTFDLYKRLLRPQANDRAMIWAGRRLSLVVMATGAFWAAFVVIRFHHIFEYFQQCWAFIALPTTVVFLLGVSWSRFSNRAAYLTLWLTLPMFAVPYLLLYFQVRTNAFVIAGYTFVGVLLLAVVVSLLTPGSINPQGAGFVIRPAMLRLPASVRRGGLRSVGLWATLLVVLYVGLYLWLG